MKQRDAVLNYFAIRFERAF